MALSYHYRKTDLSSVFHVPTADHWIRPEHRIAFDTKVDVGVGLWLESSLTMLEMPTDSLQYTKMTTLGTDYTFPIGNGLGFVAEIMHVGSGKQLLNSDVNSVLFAGMLNYSVGISDSFSAISFIDFANKNWYQFISWQRTYNKLSFNVMLFRNPKNTTAQSLAFQGSKMMGGSGIQFLLNYNF